MANLKENNYHNLKLRVNKDEYWDFFINKDSYGSFNFSSKNMYDNCLISYIDASLPECYSGDTWLFSSSNYQWENAYTTKYTLNNIGYTGIDNGLITYRKDRISNKDFFEIFTKSKYDIVENDNRLKLHAVSGNTFLYEYPVHIENDSIKLNGGFYQGFFMTECNKYRVLPFKMDNGDTWELEFELNKCELEKESDKTLNDKYPNNKGIFFYLGTRAENKWIYMYDEEDVEGKEACFTLSYDDYIEDAHIDKKDYIVGYFYNMEPEGVDDCSKQDETQSGETIDGLNVKPVPFYNICGCYIKNKNKQSGKAIQYDYNNLVLDNDDYDYIEPELNIVDFEYETDNGFLLPSANDYYFYTDNKFLLFDRTKTGYTVKNWIEGTQMMYYGKKDKFKENLFTLMNRTSTGYTVNDIDILRDKANNTYDSFYDDIYNNAFALRITDNGEIGYRYLTFDCESENEHKIKIEEGYSFPNVISECEWHTVHIKIKKNFNKIKLYFYVDGKLVYITKQLPDFNFHALNDLYEKQEGVPFNISLGGGTQGLGDTVQINYMLEPTRLYPLEENFAGTFIGYIKSFKFYNCGMEYMNILNNFKNKI